MDKLNAIKVEAKTGNESFSFDDNDLDFKLSEFWAWSQSDLLNNTLRGVLAEFIVRQALGIKKTTRTEWDAYDLETENGYKIEIKSSAYLQSWNQTELSKISFNIAPTKGWNADTNKYSDEIKRQSDYYIFCLLKHQDKSSVNPLDLNQWVFYVLPTEVLNIERTDQKSISLNSLLSLNPKECSFGEISNTF